MEFCKRLGFFRIMAASGHKTVGVFKRCNTVTKEELNKLVPGTLGTYVATNKKGTETVPFKYLIMVGDAGLEPTTFGSGDQKRTLTANYLTLSLGL
ncbi:MAG: hypothetical protein V1736_07190 [Pseudomonadota bacterium]